MRAAATTDIFYTSSSHTALEEKASFNLASPTYLSIIARSLRRYRVLHILTVSTKGKSRESQTKTFDYVMREAGNCNVHGKESVPHGPRVVSFFKTF